MSSIGTPKQYELNMRALNAFIKEKPSYRLMLILGKGIMLLVHHDTC